jgi:hypothetical protein
MKKLHFIALSITGILSAPIIADELSVCKSDLTKQMKRFEKVDFTIPRIIQTGKLKEYALKMEVLCPWQLEIDLNGDKQADWVGIVHRNNHFELVAYLSSSRKFSLHVLHEYQFFPDQTLLKVTRNNKYKKNTYGSIKYNLQEMSFNGESRIYSFEKGKMKVVKQYMEVMNSKETKKDLEARHKKEIEQLLKYRLKSS